MALRAAAQGNLAGLIGLPAWGGWPRSPTTCPGSPTPHSSSAGWGSLHLRDQNQALSQRGVKPQVAALLGSRANALARPHPTAPLPPRRLSPAAVGRVARPARVRPVPAAPVGTGPRARAARAARPGSPPAQPRHVAERRGHAQERLLLLVHGAGDDKGRAGTDGDRGRRRKHHGRPRLRCRKTSRAPRHPRPGSKVRGPPKPRPPRGPWRKFRNGAQATSGRG